MAKKVAPLPVERFTLNRQMPMKILFVHEVSWFSKVVYEMHDFPELLSLNGHEVQFLEFEEEQARAHFKSVTSIESRSHPGSKVSVTSPPHLFSGVLRRLIALVIHPLVFLRLTKKFKPDVVVTYSIPTSGWQIVTICNWLNIPIIVRAIDVSHKLRKSRFELAIKIAEQFVYKHADHVCANNEALRQYCIQMGAKLDKSSVIYPGIDLNRFSPLAACQDLQESLGIRTTDKVLLFMGTLFRFSGLVELINELAPSLLNDQSLKLLIIGDGEDFDRLQQVNDELNLDSQILMPGRIEYDDLADYLRLGDVALLPFSPAIVTHNALPGKVLQYLACGLPTIATPLHGLMSMIPQGQGVIYANDYSAMALAAINLVKDADQQKILSERGLVSLTQQCDWNSQITKFEKLLKRVSIV
jgi:glycosyltransferase involved in cell wall biosynthesis